MADDFFCWKCGETLQGLLFPISRRDECEECRAELHACRFCQYYEPLRLGACSEDQAEEVREKERANFCDYFKPQANIRVQKNKAEKSIARDKLADLFGEKGIENDVVVSGVKPEKTAVETLEGLFQTSDSKK